jgi:vacuolar-type H+-ATPase subunit F/Vma7
MTFVVRALCAPETAIGFSLAGVRTIEADPVKSLDEQVLELALDPELAVLLIDEALSDRLGEETKKRFSKKPLPMLVPFPRAHWTEGQAVDDYVVELLRRAIGYRVRLK